MPGSLVGRARRWRWQQAAAALCCIGLAGCYVTAPSESHETLKLLEPDGSTAVIGLDPYPGVPLHVEIRCNGRLRGFLASPLLSLDDQLPEILDYAFARQHVLVFLSRAPDVVMDDTQTWDEGMARFEPGPAALISATGDAVPLARPNQALSHAGEADTRVLDFSSSCQALDGGELRLAPLRYRSKGFPATSFRLRYTRLTASELQYL